MAIGPGKWSPAEATKRINECAKSMHLNVARTRHANDQLLERDLIMGDLVHLLKMGFVYEEPAPATREGFFKYCIEGRTPNSGRRTVRAVVIPNGDCNLKIVTVMWRDEK
jgi:Domain of unknown function (DUF4258)